MLHTERNPWPHLQKHASLCVCVCMCACVCVCMRALLYVCRYELFWPEKGEFVRMAAKHEAWVVPISAIGWVRAACMHAEKAMPFTTHMPCSAHIPWNTCMLFATCVVLSEVCLAAPIHPGPYRSSNVTGLHLSSSARLLSMLCWYAVVIVSVVSYAHRKTV